MANKETVLIEFHMKNEGMKEVVINAEKVNMSFKKVKKSSGEVGKGMFDITNKGRFMSNIMSKLRSKLLLVSFAAGMLSKIFVSLTKRFIEQEKAVKKLEAAVGKNTKGLIAQAAALQQVTTFGDEVIINAQALIGAYVKDEEHLKAATKATLDLAAAKGMDLATAADLVGKSLGSSTNALSRYGVSVVGAAGSTKRLNSLTTNIAKLFGGMATAETNTLSGALAQLNNALGDANEILGESLAPHIVKFAKGLKDVAEQASVFIDRKTKDDMLIVIDNLEKMGENTDTLRLIYEKTRLKEFNDEISEQGHAFRSWNLSMADTEQVQALVNAGFSEMEAKLISQREKIKALGKATEENLVDNYKELGHEIHTVSDEHGDYNKVVNDSKQTVISFWDKLKIGVKLATTWDLEVFKNLSRSQDARIDYLDSLDDGNRKEIEQSKEKAENALMEVNWTQHLINKDEKRAKTVAKLMVLFNEYAEIQRNIADLEANIRGDEEEVPFFQRMFGVLADEGKMKELKESILEWGNAVTKIADNYLGAEQARLDASKSTELAAANEIKWEKKRQSEIDKINKKYEAEQDSLNRKNKRIQRTQTVINTASGIMGAYADTSSTNMLRKHIMAVLIAAQGASQLATIDAAKYRYGGFVGGRSHSQGGTMIEAERGEFVMRREAVEAVGIETMNRINQGGGAGNINISFNGNVLSKDFIEDEAIPQIKEAIRRGADIGVG